MSERADSPCCCPIPLAAPYQDNATCAACGWPWRDHKASDLLRRVHNQHPPVKGDDVNKIVPANLGQ